MKRGIKKSIKLIDAMENKTRILNHLRRPVRLLEYRLPAKVSDQVNNIAQSIHYGKDHQVITLDECPKNSVVDATGKERKEAGRYLEKSTEKRTNVPENSYFCRLLIIKFSPYNYWLERI